MRFVSCFFALPQAETGSFEMARALLRVPSDVALAAFDSVHGALCEHAQARQSPDSSSVSVCAARTLNAIGHTWVTLSLR